MPLARSTSLNVIGVGEVHARWEVAAAEIVLQRVQTRRIRAAATPPVAGGYCLAFGMVGVINSRDRHFFAHGGIWALGLRTNLAFSVLSIIVGAVVVVGALVGRNVDHRLNLVAGPTFLVVGVMMLGLMDSDANFLNFGMSTVIVSFIIGLVLLTAGMYGQVASPQAAAMEEEFRQGRRGDPTEHAAWGDLGDDHLSRAVGA